MEITLGRAQEECLYLLRLISLLGEINKEKTGGNSSKVRKETQEEGNLSIGYTGWLKKELLTLPRLRTPNAFYIIGVKKGGLERSYK